MDDDVDASERLDWSTLLPSAETLDFVASARAHLSGLYPVDILRQMVDGAAAPMGTWADFIDQGYLQVGLPEDHEGFGEMADLAAVLEALGRALIPVPALVTVASMQTLVGARLPLDALGAAPSALAIAHDGAQRVRVFDGAQAKAVTVLRPGDGTTTIELVTGVVVAGSPQDTVDPSRATVDFDVQSVVEQVVLDVPIDVALARARCCVAADLVGIGARALDDAIEHAKRREQFGRPIGSFQGVQRLLVDVHVAIERARSLTLGAAASISAGPINAPSPEGVSLSVLAKAAASEAAVCATALQIQLLGAMGLTWEADSALALRRARATAGFLGSPGQLYAHAGRTKLAEARHG